MQFFLTSLPHLPQLKNIYVNVLSSPIQESFSACCIPDAWGTAKIPFS